MEVKYVDSRARKFAAWSIMILILFAFIALILVQIFYPRPVAEMNSEDLQIHTQSVGAANIAERFAGAWIRGDLDLINYYTSKGFVVEKEDITVPDELSVSYQRAVDTYSQGEGREIVEVEVYVKPKKGDTYRVIVSVPVLAVDGAYGVYDYPAIIPAKERPTKPDSPVEEMALVEEDEQTIREQMERFFQAYTENRMKDIRSMYSKSDEAPQSGIPGKFNGIEEVEIYGQSDKKAMVHVLVSITVGDIESKQRFQFQMEKEESEWKIKNSTPRL